MSAAVKEVAVAVVEPKPLAITLDDRAKRINEAHDALGGALNQAGNWAVILGVELHAASAALGERRGGDRKSTGIKTAKLAVLIEGEEPTPAKQTFPEWLKAHCPAVKQRSAELYMQLAKAAKKHLIKNGEEAIRALLAKPSSDLTEADRKQLLNTIRKTTDGKTYEQLALEFGIKGGKGKKVAKGTGDNGQDAKNQSGEPPLGWSAEEWDARNAADPEAQEAIDICRPVETGLLQILEAGTLAHLPDRFRANLATAIAQMSAALADIAGKTTPRK